MTCTFATNVYEKTYRHALAPGFLRAMANQHHFQFDEVLLAINNVDSRAHAAIMAQAAVERGEITRFIFVEDELPHALQICGLKDRDLGSMRHYTDCYLAILASAQTEFVLYQDVEWPAQSDFDWVTPAIQILREKPYVLHVNPSWSVDRDVVINEGFARDGNYVVGYGFTEGCVVLRRNVLLAPIYKRTHLASLRYPFATFCPVFEQWIDSYMRQEGLFRYTDLRATFGQTAAVEGAHYPHFSRYIRMKRKLYTRLARYGMRQSNRKGQRLYAQRQMQITSQHEMAQSSARRR